MAALRNMVRWAKRIRNIYKAVCRWVVTKIMSRCSAELESFKEKPSPQPSCRLLYIKGNRTRMSGFDADKKSVVETWNQFVASLSSAFLAYYEARKVSMMSCCGVVFREEPFCNLPGSF